MAETVSDFLLERLSEWGALQEQNAVPVPPRMHDTVHTGAGYSGSWTSR